MKCIFFYLLLIFFMLFDLKNLLNLILIILLLSVVWVIFNELLTSISVNPSLSKELFNYAIIVFALTEAISIIYYYDSVLDFVFFYYNQKSIIFNVSTFLI